MTSEGESTFFKTTKMRKLLLILFTLSLTNSELTNVVSLWQYQNYIIPDLKFVCLNSTINVNVSKLCEEQLNEVCQNSALFSTMLDATSKFPYSGLNYASRLDYGNFDECLTIDYKYDDGRILGEYCLSGLIIPDFFSATIDIDSIFQVSICKPNGCTANDLNAILMNMTSINISLFNDIACQTVETNNKYSATDIITITIIVTCVLLMILSSTYDFYLRKKQLETSNEIFLAFSVIYNGKKLLHVTKSSKEQISTFHGMRAIGILWIIAGHAISVWIIQGVENAPDIAEWQTKLSSVYMIAASLAVDTFFFMSGFLLAYQYLKQKPKPFIEHVKTVPSLYLHRYLRLTPAVAMLFLVTISLWKHIGYGPKWPTIAEHHSSACRENWWSFFLYIQNYVNYDPNKMCMIMTWYLCADMQMFFLSPLVIIPIAVFLQRPKGFKICMAALFTLNLFFIILPLAIKLIFRDYTNTLDTHSYIIDYFCGVMAGVFMRVKKDKPFLYTIKSTQKSMINLLTWIIVLLGMFAIFMCLQEIPLHQGYENNVVFTSLMKPAWCIGLSWIVYSSHFGYGGIVNWILSRPIFQIWGRLTYCMYLLHIPIILLYLGNLRTRWYFSDYNEFYLFWGHFAVTLIVSTFWTLAFEAPLITIEKVLFGKRVTKREEPRSGDSVKDNVG